MGIELELLTPQHHFVMLFLLISLLQSVHRHLSDIYVFTPSSNECRWSSAVSPTLLPVPSYAPKTLFGLPSHDSSSPSKVN